LSILSEAKDLAPFAKSARCFGVPQHDRAHHSGSNGPASGLVKNKRPGIVGMNVAGSQGLGPY
jgi:hypothetical protein